MRFKINYDCLFFDQNKELYLKEIPKAYGIFIIHLSGLWLMNDNLWLLQQQLHQGVDHSHQ